MSRLREVFDNQKFYTEAFKESYLNSDARRIVLAYKVNLVLKPMFTIRKHCKDGHQSEGAGQIRQDMTF